MFLRFPLGNALATRPQRPPTAVGKGGYDGEDKNMDVFSLIPALWNRPCPPTAAPVHDGRDKGITWKSETTVT